MNNQTIETNSMPFKSVLTALLLGFLERERERERRQNFKIDSQTHSFTKINPRHSSMIFNMIASSLFLKYSLA
ncbi:hypothetical protein [Helicobacter pylori]|uniref:hypothetical protein n=1 Tax=Helicobacter pylori TaxID=210 RepID=UPI0018F19B80|nr:hypothetical protein [Helicobacter pylori]